jgi:thiol:disulfide interchange protein
MNGTHPPTRPWPALAALVILGGIAFTLFGIRTAGRMLTAGPGGSPLRLEPASVRSPGERGAAVSSGWRKGASGFSDADEERKRLGAPMAVYFYTDWCGYCRRLDSEYFSSSEVEETLRGVVRVRINPETGAAEQAIAKRFGVRGYPSFFIVSADGGAKRVHPFRSDGEMSPRDFAEACRAAE